MSPVSKGRRRKGHTHRTRAGSPARVEPTRPTAAPKHKIRPGWHKPLGWTVVALGVFVIIGNDVAYVAKSILPGGHSEAYLLLGLIVAGVGSVFLGLFDRP